MKRYQYRFHVGSYQVLKDVPEKLMGDSCAPGLACSQS